MKRLARKLAQWWRRVRWHYFVRQADWHINCTQINQRLADEVWLGKGKARVPHKGSIR